MKQRSTEFSPYSPVSNKRADKDSPASPIRRSIRFSTPASFHYFCPISAYSLDTSKPMTCLVAAPGRFKLSPCRQEANARVVVPRKTPTSTTILASIISNSMQSKLASSGAPAIPAPWRFWIAPWSATSSAVGFKLFLLAWAWIFRGIYATSRVAVI